ncbi:hypothetical protein B4Q13_15250 [Lacticaseibacillus rhamnosus]
MLGQQFGVTDGARVAEQHPAARRPGAAPRLAAACPRQAPIRVCSDLSATLFLTDPADYDGGELVIEDTFGSHTVKLPAGDLVLYSATSRHHVTAVTRGSRWGSFFWVQSMVQDDAARGMLLALDQAVQGLRSQVGDNEQVVSRGLSRRSDDRPNRHALAGLVVAGQVFLGAEAAAVIRQVLGQGGALAGQRPLLGFRHC